ncbi:uncharacterized protein METZ01_LOCUS509393, partial [marine metagenome]
VCGPGGNASITGAGVPGSYPGGRATANSTVVPSAVVREVKSAALIGSVPYDRMSNVTIIDRGKQLMTLRPAGTWLVAPRSIFQGLINAILHPDFHCGGL